MLNFHKCFEKMNEQTQENDRKQIKYCYEEFALNLISGGDVITSRVLANNSTICEYQILTKYNN